MSIDRVGVETLLLAIGWQGAAPVVLDHRESIRTIYREDWPAWLEIKLKLQEGEMPLHAIMDLVCDEHPSDCACWNCLLALQSEIFRTRALFTFGKPAE